MPAANSVADVDPPEPRRGGKAAGVSSKPTRCESSADEAARLLLTPPVTAQVLRQAGSLLVTGCGPALMRKLHNAWRMNDEDAEEVMLDAIRAFMEKPPTSAPPQAYLYMWLERKATDRWRHDQAIAHGGDTHIQSLTCQSAEGEGEEEFSIDVPDERDDLRRLDLRRCIERCFARMAAEDATYAPLLGCLAEGLSIQEVADRLRITLVAAKDRMFRVRQAASRYFKDCKE